MKMQRVGRVQSIERRGFTLIELVIVVLIMGVLAVLATYAVTRYIQESKTSEAREIIGSIMAGQEAFRSETGSYLDVTGGVTDSDFYPDDSTFDGTTAIMWGAPDGCQNAATIPCIDSFNALGVNVNSAVLFRYASTTFPAGSAPPTARAPQYNPNGVTSPRQGYVVIAVSDLDGDGGAMSVLVGSSMIAAIHVENAGE